MDADQAPSKRLLRMRIEPVGLIDPDDPDAEPLPRARSCPRAIIDTDPEGHGLGVWILVESDAETCTYEYAGGIV
ncbi:MAG TPA: hypothetical protein VK875_01005 [Euzebyales bacterium]|nr:hypothetical protein [Euzebyales bacterium]